MGTALFSVPQLRQAWQSMPRQMCSQFVYVVPSAVAALWHVLHLIAVPDSNHGGIW